jgi:hypothetical protein
VDGEKVMDDDVEVLAVGEFVEDNEKERDIDEEREHVGEWDCDDTVVDDEKVMDADVEVLAVGEFVEDNEYERDTDDEREHVGEWDCDDIVVDGEKVMDGDVDSDVQVKLNDPDRDMEIVRENVEE